MTLTVPRATSPHPASLRLHDQAFSPFNLDRSRLTGSGQVTRSCQRYVVPTAYTHASFSDQSVIRAACVPWSESVFQAKLPSCKPQSQNRLTPTSFAFPDSDVDRPAALVATSFFSGMFSIRKGKARLLSRTSQGMQKETPQCTHVEACSGSRRDRTRLLNPSLITLLLAPSIPRYVPACPPRALASAFSQRRSQEHLASCCKESYATQIGCPHAGHLTLFFSPGPMSTCRPRQRQNLFAIAHTTTAAPTAALTGRTMDSLSYQRVSESRSATFDSGCGAGVGQNGLGNEEIVAPAVGEIVGEVVGETVGAADGPVRRYVEGDTHTLFLVIKICTSKYESCFGEPHLLDRATSPKTHPALRARQLSSDMFLFGLECTRLWRGSGLHTGE